MGIITALIPCIILYFLFYNSIIRQLNIRIIEFFRLKHITLYLMIIYSYFNMTTYSIIPIILTSLIITLQIIVLHPYYNFPIENSNFMLLFIAIIYCYQIYNIINITLILINVLTLNLIKLI